MWGKKERIKNRVRTERERKRKRLCFLSQTGIRFVCLWEKKRKRK